MKKYLKWLKLRIRRILSNDYVEEPIVKYDEDWFNNVRNTVNNNQYIPKGCEESYTAAYMRQRQLDAQMSMMRLEAEEKALAAERAPQRAMDKFLGGVAYNDALELIKQHYPEKFI